MATVARGTSESKSETANRSSAVPIPRWSSAASPRSLAVGASDYPQPYLARQEHPRRLRTSSSGVGFNVSKCAKILLGHCPGRDAVTVLDYLIGALYGLQKAIELEFVDRRGVRHSAYHPRLPQYVGALQKSEPPSTSFGWRDSPCTLQIHLQIQPLPLTESQRCSKLAV